MHMRYRLWKAYYQVSSPLVAAPCAAIKSDLFGAGNLSLTTFSESIKVCVFVRARVTSFSWKILETKSQNQTYVETFKTQKSCGSHFSETLQKIPIFSSTEHLRRVFTSPTTYLDPSGSKSWNKNSKSWKNWKIRTQPASRKSYNWVVVSIIFFNVHHYLGKWFPFWLIFFKGVETTN